MTNPRMGLGWTPLASADGRGRAHSRAELLKRSAALSCAALAGGGFATALAHGESRAPTPRDTRILNYVLRLEYLKEAFYREAGEGGALSGEIRQLAALLARHEQEHVAFFRKRLGGQAEEARTYDFGDATGDSDAFAATANKLEETAVAAYIGQGAHLSYALMVPFAQVCSVEARHAAWIADVLQTDPAPRAADAAMAPEDVLRTIDSLGFETHG